jgi:hypothetical protein
MAQRASVRGKGHRLVCTVDFVVVCCVLSVGVRCAVLRCAVWCASHLRGASVRE